MSPEYAPLLGAGIRYLSLNFYMKNRNQRFSDARSLISYFAVREMGHNGAKVARILNISRSGVSAAADRGEDLVKKNQNYRDFVDK